jgi:hypothetical protein
MKHLLICPELGGQGPFEVPQLKSIISNEVTNAPVKHANPVTRRAVFHTLMTANELPSTWANKDQGGAIARRFATLAMMHPVETLDDSLQDRGAGTVCQFIIKATRSYARLRWTSGTHQLDARCFKDLDNTVIEGGLLGGHFAQGARILTAKCNPHSFFLEWLLEELYAKQGCLNVRNNTCSLRLVRLEHEPADAAEWLQDLVKHAKAGSFVAQRSWRAYDNVPLRMLALLCECEESELAQAQFDASEAILGRLHRHQAPLRMLLRAMFQKQPAKHLGAYDELLGLVAPCVRRLERNESLTLVEVEDLLLDSDGLRGEATDFARFAAEMRAWRSQANRTMQLTVDDSPLFASWKTFKPYVHGYCRMADIEERHKEFNSAEETGVKKIKWQKSHDGAQALAKDSVTCKFFAGFSDKHQDLSLLLLLEAAELSGDDGQ